MIDEYNILRKKKRKDNGFATTALLISLGIIILLVAIFVFLLGKVDRKDDSANSGSNTTTQEVCNDKGECTTVVNCGSKESVFNENLKTIKDAAVSYFTLERMPKNKGEVKKITLAEMQKEKMVLSIIDSKNNTCYGDKSYVEVTKDTNEYVMKIYLSCSDMEDYIIIHLGCYDYCKGTVCEKQDDEGRKEFEYEYKKTTSCTMTNWSSWSEWKTTKETTSNLKKEETKTETIQKIVQDEKPATLSPVTYNCKKYPGYTLVGDKCVANENEKITIPATKEDTYTCKEYPGYTLSGKKCIKEVTSLDVKTAIKNESTYSCPNGYVRDTIYYTVKSGDTISSIARANSISVSALMLANNLSSNSLTTGQKLVIPEKYQTVCYKIVNEPDYKEATAEYGKKNVPYTCYEKVCSTKLVPSCDKGYCEIEEVRVCDNISKKCTKTELYIKGYNCNNYSGYTLTSDNKCMKEVPVKKTISAIKDTDTYNCNSYDGYSLKGNKCYKDIVVTDEKDASIESGEYKCNASEEFELSGNQCIKTVTKKVTENADKNEQTYKCTIDGYTLNKNNVCVKDITTNVKVTYYRYATRKCTGGSTEIKWSLDSHDLTLLNNGYVLTGNKREVSNSNNTIVK